MASHDRTDQEIFEALQAAEAVAQRLQALIGSSGPGFTSAQFYTRIRVKSYSSIVHKIQRKRRKKGDELYSFYDITDLVGFRIVTLYDDHIQTAIDDLLNLIAAGSEFDQFLFKPYKPLNEKKLTTWDYIREISCYRRRRNKEDAHSKAHSTIKNKITAQFSRDQKALKHHLDKLKLPDDPDHEEYSSTHFLISAASTVGKKDIDVPIEVQIRTAAEDIWGEINHQIFYKAEDLYVWSPELEKIYRDMKLDSASVQDASLYKIEPAITRFWRHAKDAELQIELFKKPETSYHRSLIVTLFYAASREHMESADRLLKSYNNKLMRLVKIADPKKARDELIECVALIKRIRDKFIEAKRKIELRKEKIFDDDELFRLTNFATLLDQRTLLCDLEIARLDALAIVRFKYLLDSQSGEMPLSEWNEHVRRVFDVICELRNESKFKIRPLAMMSFWKYIIGQHIDHELGIYHLRLAAEELERDSSLPEWSIYHTIIPRYLSAELYNEAKELVRANGRRSSRQVWWRSQLAVDVRVKLGKALEFGLLSYARHLQHDKRVGDLVFGYELDEHIRDTDAIANAASIYFILFDSPDYKKLGTTPQFILERVRDVHTYFTGLGSSEDWIVQKIRRLKRLMERLAADIQS
jgi:ppGpp synthetase/RelA/SpoT-type nucleotidyltranferase